MRARRARCLSWRPSIRGIIQEARPPIPARSGALPSPMRLRLRSTRVAGTLGRMGGADGEGLGRDLALGAHRAPAVGDEVGGYVGVLEPPRSGARRAARR